MKKLTLLLIGLCVCAMGNAQIDITSQPKYTCLDSMLAYAQTLIRRPYRSGAEGPYAFDCSGFTRYCYKQLGIQLQRVSRDQGENGRRIRFKRHFKPGDLVFYKGSTGDEIGHVGIILRKGEDKKTFDFIHASSSKGITISNSETEYYATRFKKVMRVTNDKAIADAIEQYTGNRPEVKESTTDSTIHRRRLMRKRRRRADSTTTAAATTTLSVNKDTLVDNKKIQVVVPKKSTSTIVEKIIENKNEQVKPQETVTPSTTTPTNSNEGLKTLPGKTYVVKKGDTMYNIARRVPCTVDELKRLNNMTDNALSIGQVLIIRE